MPYSYQVRSYTHPTVVMQSSAPILDDEFIQYNYDEVALCDYQEEFLQNLDVYCECKIKESNDQSISMLCLRFSLTGENHEMLQYINNHLKNQCALVSDIDCRDTLFREVKSHQVQLINNSTIALYIEIPLDQVVGDLVANFHLVSTEDIIDYQPSLLNEEYQDAQVSEFIVNAHAPLMSFIGVKVNLDYKWLIYLQVIVFVHRMLFLLMVKILALNVRKILLAMMQLPVAQIALVLLRGRLVATTSRVHWTVEIASKS